MSTAAMNTAVMNGSAFSNGSARMNSSASTNGAVGTSRLRITRRGYALLTLVVAAPLVIAAFGFAVNSGGAAATADPSSVSFEHVTVQPGESLWQLAGEIAPSSDPRDVVSDIVQLNQLDSAEVQPGQSLAVPLKYSH